MLKGKYRGWYQDGRLLAVDGSLEGGAHGNFCLAESHIATDEAIHGSRTFHISFHIGCGLQLIWGIFIDETGFEFVLEVAVGAVGETFLLAATGVELNEVAGDVLNLGLRAFFHTLPGSCAKAAYAWRFAFLALVFRDFM